MCITAIINHKFVSFSAIQIYDFSCIHLHQRIKHLKMIYFQLRAILTHVQDSENFSLAEIFGQNHGIN